MGAVEFVIVTPSSNQLAGVAQVCKQVLVEARVA